MSIDSLRSTVVSAASRLLAPGGDHKFVALFLCSRVTSAGLSALLAITAFAYAGAAKVGLYSAIAAGFAVAGGMAGGWLAQGILRFHQLSDVPTATLLAWVPRRSLMLCLLLVLAGGIIGGLLAGTTLGTVAWTALLALLVSCSFAFITIQQARAMARHQGILVVVNELSRACSLTAPPLIAVTAWTQQSVPFAMRCLCVALALHALALVCGKLLWPTTSEKQARQSAGPYPRWPTQATFLKYSAPLGLWIGLAAIYQNSDRIVLSWLASDPVAGEYALIYDISNRGLMLPVTALSGAASASVLRMFNLGDSQSARRVNRILVRTQAALIIACGLIVLLGCFVASSQLEWFEGEHTTVAVATFLAGGVWTIADTIQRERLGQGNTLPMVKWLGVVAITGLVANTAFVPLLGIVGAALVTLFSAIAYATCVIVYTPRVFPSGVDDGDVS